jgi:hypothetical protein
MSYGAEKGNAPVSVIGFFPCPFSAPIVGPGWDPCGVICVPEGGRIQWETKGGAGEPALLSIIISNRNSRIVKSFTFPGQALFEAPKTPFRNVAIPPFEGESVVFANRPDLFAHRLVPSPPEKKSDARRRYVTLRLNSGISDPKKKFWSLLKA